MTAAHLSARGIPALLIDTAERFGRGLAYSTRQPVHILNVVTAKMSAWPADPAHFATWSGDDGTTFAERREFGRYVEEQLAAAPLVKRAGGMAVDAERDEGGWTVTLSDGAKVAASALVLALGNQPPAPFPGSDGLPEQRFVNNPWSDAAEVAIARAAESQSDVLILGTGLTMIDVVLSLAAAGHEGRITAVSRRGLVPRAHVSPPGAPSPVSLEEVPLGSLMALWRWLRIRSAEVGFRAAVDAIRPHSLAIWRSLPHADRRRFLRHARPQWDVHRHRIAPQVAEQIKGMIAAGQLDIIAGRVASMQASADELEISIARRDGRESVRRVATAFNCTGPLGDIRRTADPLLRALLADGEISFDSLSLGLEVDERSKAGPSLWALGPLTKGMYWEIVAVPDIRGQAEAVASDIHKELLSHG
ncbi:FAD/NAD(P)-binding protein [Sphingomonas humi]|uniref:FAD/NAD(P)-binding protein n=2 Tax=Sphingomonas humi TaxID=335630 RepID=A0ABP7S874_9SPHN